MANVIVVGAQWGDEGKGKVVDALTASADLVVRYAGGANAGHTLMVNGERLVVHLLPSGVVHPGKRCLLGSGMVIDPEALLEEIQLLGERGFVLEPATLGISWHAHVILPYHKTLDGLHDQGTLAIGTTRKGIGPSYEDKMARRGIQMWQLAKPDALAPALKVAVAAANSRIRLLSGDLHDADTLLSRFTAVGRQIAPYLCDVARVVHGELSRGAQVLFEGAQGALLDIDHGTYPYVTSSNTVAGGACTGTGIGPTHIQAVLGIVKAYTTRVGNGPFPTEMGGALEERLRTKGGEYGATTGRPRRCGWLDGVALARAVRLSGITSLAVTKLDVLGGMDPLRICTGYLLGGERLDDFPAGTADLGRVEPIYEDMEGFSEDLRQVRSMVDLPRGARAYLDRLSELARAPIGLVSVGPAREETIILDNPFGDR